MKQKLLSIGLCIAILLSICNAQIASANEFIYESSQLAEDPEYDNSKNKNSDSENSISLFSYSTGYPNTYTNTGNQAIDIAGIAKTQIGYTETSNHTKYNQWFYGSDTEAAWCAIFISWCANQAGISTSVIAKNARASGYSTSNMSSNPYGCPAVSFSNRTPQVGDIIFVDNNSDNVSNHVGLVVDIDDTYIYTVEGNYSDKVSSVKYKRSNGYRNGSSSTKIVFYALPNYVDNSQPQYYNPQGVVDACVGGENSITVSGWAFDRDEPNTSIPIHIYIGGGAGSANAEGYPITADIYREDVNSAYGISGNHGFSAVIPTSKIGTQNVYIYACDVGGGSNILLSSYTVDITNETLPPVISDIKISNLTETGYTITCRVSDNSGIKKVMFPVWTAYNSQDDIIWHTGTIDGNTATCTVNIKDHNNEHADYHAHIYATDIYDNTTFVIAPSVFIPVKATPSENLIVNNKKYILFENAENLMWHEVKLYCEQIGGYLATVTSESEQQIIDDLTQNYNCTHYFLGATDSQTEGTWKWVTDEKWDYTNWLLGEPNNYGGDEDYLSITKNDHKWIDGINSPIETAGFICEIDLPYTKTTITDYGTYKLCNSDLFNVPTPASIIVSAYKDNQLISCEIRDVSDNNTFAIIGDIDKIKVMVWDSTSTMTPLTTAEVINSSEFIN